MQTTNRDLIIQESIKLFYTNGFNKTTMRQIAKACNIAHPSIFNHFRSKTEIADIMFFRFLNGFDRITQKYIDDKKLDRGETHEALVFYWSAHYYFIKKDHGYFNFLRDLFTLKKMGDPVIVSNFGKVFERFLHLHYDEPLKKQILYSRLAISASMVISASYYDGIISLEEAVIEHFYVLYSTFKIKRGITDNEIAEFLFNLDIPKYMNIDFLKDALLSDGGKPYGNDIFPLF